MSALAGQLLLREVENPASASHLAPRLARIYHCLLAHHWMTTNGDTTETCCSRLLALGAPRGPLRLRLSQSAL